jgi:DNA-binding NtrC family response regulator
VNRPLVLFIDDVYGKSQAERYAICERLQIQPINPGDELLVEGAVADAWFCSSQRVTPGLVTNDAAVALETIQAFWEGSPQRRLALVLLDLQFEYGPVSEGPLDPDLNWPRKAGAVFGLDILQAMVNRWPDLAKGNGHCRVPVVMLSDQTRLERSGQANRAGALVYVEKDELTSERLASLVDEHGLIEDESGALSGRSIALLGALRLARESARCARGNLLILGGRGTGKTSVANYIHRHSPRAKRPMLTFTVRPGADELLVGELFGSWTGAYTGSGGAQIGAAERAHQGILFLDEVANLPPQGQKNLLDYGRPEKDGSRTVRRLGNFPQPPARPGAILGVFDAQTHLISVDVFLITATNQPIDDPAYRAKSGFLADFLDRLRQFGDHLAFPSLVDRTDDIPVLFEQFLVEETLKQGGVWPKRIESAVLQRLAQYDWPGNVADLQRVAIGVARQAKGWDEVLERFLPKYILQADRATLTTPPPLPTLPPPAENPDGARQSDPSPRAQLDGALLRLNGEYGRKAEALLEAALDMTLDPYHSAPKSEILGNLCPTKAMKILLRQNMTTMQAADVIKRIFELSGTEPAEGSLSARVLRYARQRRRAGSSKREEDSE